MSSQEENMTMMGRRRLEELEKALESARWAKKYALESFEHQRTVIDALRLENESLKSELASLKALAESSR
jgi:hypothetical protein